MTNEEYLYALKTLYCHPIREPLRPARRSAKRPFGRAAIPLPSAVALRLGAKGMGA
jgi:hypothetical protein